MMNFVIESSLIIDALVMSSGSNSCAYGQVPVGSGESRMLTRHDQVARTDSKIVGIRSKSLVFRYR